jgi:hypothetical protein
MDMKKMMKQAQKMQREAAAAQAEMEAMEFSASAGGGMVEATVKGSGEVVSLHISPDAVDPEDVEMLEDMIVAAINEAVKTAAQTSSQRMDSIMGGMKIPGLM